MRLEAGNWYNMSDPFVVCKSFMMIYVVEVQDFVNMLVSIFDWTEVRLLLFMNWWKQVEMFLDQIPTKNHRSEEGSLCKRGYQVENIWGNSRLLLQKDVLIL